MTSQSKSPRVLSIQRHFVHGYSGNKSAVFPLQLLNFDVDAIHSTQLSNHSGYNIVKKTKTLIGSEIAELFDGLVANNLHSTYSHLLTGYIGHDESLREISRIVKSLREANPNLTYVCDPIMGDYDKKIVKNSLLPIYRDEIIPLADIVTPNHYEVELLTNEKICNESDAWKSMEWFHSRGVKMVALSSDKIGGSNVQIALLSAKKADGSSEKFKITIPKHEKITLIGTGALFAALLLAHTTQLPNDLGRAFELTIAAVQSVIELTLNSLPEDVQNGSVHVQAQQRELKIIQSKKFIEEPVIRLKAVKIE